MFFETYLLSLKFLFFMFPLSENSCSLLAPPLKSSSGGGGSNASWVTAIILLVVVAVVVVVATVVYFKRKGVLFKGVRVRYEIMNPFLRALFA